MTILMMNTLLTVPLVFLFHPLKTKLQLANPGPGTLGNWDQATEFSIDDPMTGPMDIPGAGVPGISCFLVQPLTFVKNQVGRCQALPWVLQQTPFLILQHFLRNNHNHNHNHSHNNHHKRNLSTTLHPLTMHPCNLKLNLNLLTCPPCVLYPSPPPFRSVFY